MFENLNFFLVTALPLYNVLSFLSVRNVLYYFSILDCILKFSLKNHLFHLLGIDTDPYRPDPDPHALDAVSDPILL